MKNRELRKNENEAAVEVLEKLHSGIIALIENDNVSELKRIEQFRTLIDKPPKKDLLKKHPYLKNVSYLPVSHVEGIMDTLFFRQWGTDNFKTELIGNEVVGSIDVWYIDPITNRKIVRTGSAAIQIMVNAPDEQQKKSMTKIELSQHALDLQNNKKPNALETGYPKLKTQAFKNACSSIGAIFGRDVNRDVMHTPSHIIPQEFEALKTLMEEGENNG